MKTSPCIRRWRGPILRFFGIKINTVNIYLIGSIGLYCTKFRRQYSKLFMGRYKVSETVCTVIYWTSQSFKDGMHSHSVDFTKFQRRYAHCCTVIQWILHSFRDGIHSRSVDFAKFWWWPKVPGMCRAHFDIRGIILTFYFIWLGIPSQSQYGGEWETLFLLWPYRRSRMFGQSFEREGIHQQELSWGANNRSLKGQGHEIFLSFIEPT